MPSKTVAAVGAPDITSRGNVQDIKRDFGETSPIVLFCDVWVALVAAVSSCIVAYILGSPAFKTNLQPLAGMDDEATLGRVQQLLDKWRSSSTESDVSSTSTFMNVLSEVISVQPPHQSLGVYEPVALACRLLVARLWEVSAHATLVTSLSLHAISVALACFLGKALSALLGASWTMPAENTKESDFTSPSKRTTQDRSLQQAICAGFAAVLMGAHPMRVEVVCWASCQPYALSCCFYLICLLCRLCRVNASSERASILPIVELVAFVFAILSKGAALSLPLVLLVVDLLVCLVSSNDPMPEDALACIKRLRLERFTIVGLFQQWLLFFPFVFIASIGGAIAAGPVGADVRPLTWGESLLRACFMARFYLSQTILPPWPWTTPRLPVPDRMTFLDARFGLSISVVLTCTLALPMSLALLRRRSSHLLLLWLGWMAYVCALSPTLGLIPGGRRHIWALAADRYAHLPAMCVFTPMLAVILDFACERIRQFKIQQRRMRAIFFVLSLGIVTIYLLWRTRQVTDMWSAGSLKLFAAVLSQQPDDFNTLRDLGTLQLKRGSIGEAQDVLAQAVSLRPAHAGALLNLATAVHQSARLTPKSIKKAEALYWAAIRSVRADMENCHQDATVVSFLEHIRQLSRLPATTCLQQRSELCKIEANLAALLLQSGRFSEVASILQRGHPWLGLPPTVRANALYHLALSSSALGQHAAASRHLHAAVAAFEGVGGGAALDKLARSDSRVIVTGRR